jgi:hypothetical protein
MKDDDSIAVVPYVVYDALMERFERSQKNLRYAAVGSILMAVSIIISLLIGVIDGNRADT